MLSTSKLPLGCEPSLPPWNEWSTASAGAAEAPPAVIAIIISSSGSATKQGFASPRAKKARPQSLPIAVSPILQRGGFLSLEVRLRPFRAWPKAWRPNRQRAADGQRLTAEDISCKALATNTIFVRFLVRFFRETNWQAPALPLRDTMPNLTAVRVPQLNRSELLFSFAAACAEKAFRSSICALAGRHRSETGVPDDRRRQLFSASSGAGF